MQDYIAMQARLKKGGFDASCTSSTETRERKLHDQILSHLQNEHWLVVHSRMDIPSTVAKGVPDFIILASKGRLIMVECKSKTGKLTPEQMGFKIMAEHLEHTVHIVRSFTEFLEVVNQITP